MSRIAERIQVLEKEGTLFSLFDYAYFEGNSFEVLLSRILKTDESFIGHHFHMSFRKR